MGFISQVIPALRDARTPLSVGVLWALTLWIGYFLIPKEHLQARLLLDIVRSFGKLPPEVVIGLGFALIYIMGIFMEMISRFFRRIVFGALIFGEALQIIYGLRYGGFAGAFGFVIACGAIYFAWSLVRHFLRSSRELSGDNFAQALSSAVESVRSPIAAFWDRIRVLLGPESIPYQEILRREIEDYYATNPYTLLDAAKSVDDRTLSNVAISMNIPVARLHLLAEDEQRRTIESTPADTLLQYRVRRDPKVAELARHVVLEQLEISSEARFEFAKQVFSLDPMHENLKDRIKDATVRLKKENNELYQEYDRMIAEGEFRRGVAIPLMALLLVVSLTLFKAFSLPVNVNRLTVPVIVAVIIGGSIYRAGTHRVRESLAFMYSCINLGYVGLEKRAIFGSEMFIPYETSNFVRRSEFSYRFEEFRSDLRLQVLELIRKVLRTPNRRSGT